MENKNELSKENLIKLLSALTAEKEKLSNPSHAIIATNGDNVNYSFTVLVNEGKYKNLIFSIIVDSKSFEGFEQTNELNFDLTVEHQQMVEKFGEEVANSFKIEPEMQQLISNIYVGLLYHGIEVETKNKLQELEVDYDGTDREPETDIETQKEKCGEDCTHCKKD